MAVIAVRLAVVPESDDEELWDSNFGEKVRNSLLGNVRARPGVGSPVSMAFVRRRAEERRLLPEVSDDRLLRWWDSKSVSSAVKVNAVADACVGRVGTKG